MARDRKAEACIVEELARDVMIGLLSIDHSTRYPLRVENLAGENTRQNHKRRDHERRI